MRASIKTFKRARRLRREMTLPEVVLWECLRKGRLGGLSFRRQHPFGVYILDFYQPGAKLAVEIDGAGHGEAAQQAHAARREAWLGEQGVRVLRFAASDVMDDETRVAILDTILRAVAPSTPLRSATGGPPPPLRG
jgi:very-short-patch-repair endonuclease